jgi:hypothetical protein
LRIGVHLDFDVSRISAFSDELTDYVSAHVEYGLKLTGKTLWVVDSPWFDLYNSDFVAGRQYSAPAVKNRSSLRLIRNLPFLLLKALLDIMVVAQKLQIEAPTGQGDKRPYQEK